MTIREDAFSTSGWNLLSTFLCLEILALLFSSPIVLAATWGIMRHTIIAYLLAFGITSPFCLPLAWSHNRYLRKRGGFIELDGDMLNYYEKGDESPLYSEPLVECLWFLGSGTWATLPRDDYEMRIVVGPPVILLQFPEWCCVPEHRSGKATVAEQSVIVAVGQTKETREQWETVLESRGIACDTTRHQRRLAPVSGGAFSCWFLFCLGFGFWTLMRLARMASNLMIGWNVPADVANAVGFSIFVPGCIFLVIWVCILPLTWISLRTGVGRVKVSRPELLIRGGAVLAIIFVPLWLGGNNETFEWKMAYTLSTSTMCVVTFVCFWFLTRSFPLER